MKKKYLFVFQWKTKNFLASLQHTDKKSNSFENFSSFAKNKHHNCKECWNGDFQWLFPPYRFVSSFDKTYLYSNIISIWNICEAHVTVTTVTVSVTVTVTAHMVKKLPYLSFTFLIPLIALNHPRKLLPFLLYRRRIWLHVIMAVWW